LPCWLICKPLGLSLFCQTLLLQSLWLFFSFLHPRNVISSPVRHVQGQRCAGNLHHLNKKHWNTYDGKGMTFHPPFRAFAFPVLPFSSQSGPCVPTVSYALSQQWL
jgi:hypothetical protein